MSIFMKVVVAKEIKNNERRVSLVPKNVSKLVSASIEVFVEKGAGEKAFFSDADYEKVGATIGSDPKALWKKGDVILKVGTLEKRVQMHEVDMISEGSVVIGFLNPFGNPQLLKQLAERRITAFSMEMIPRTTRAQSMDAISSQASVSGYKASLLAANKLGQLFPMMTTAAGTMIPAKVLVIGAGVAGLQAIATARRLGAVVEGFDIRPSSKEEVESLGATFIEIKFEEKTQDAEGYAKEVSEDAKRREREILLQHLKQSDVVITTALVPGKKAPLLITEDMVKDMKKGSIIVDIAAEQGGNCALTQAGKEVIHNGVTIIGADNLPSTIPVHASQMYSKNIFSLLQHITKDGKLNLDFDDDIINKSCVTHDGAIRNE